MKRIATILLLLAFAAGAAAWRLQDVKPDPNAQAVADGCQRDTTKIYTGFAPNWVYVNDKDYPASGPPPAPKWVQGGVAGASGLLASRVASSDDPITHVSYDVNIDLRVGSGYDYLTGVSRDATSEQGTIHMERESGSLPMWVWPRPGDFVRALGSWVWDCDHYQGTGEKTEFHPFRAIWVVRPQEADLYVSSVATPAGQEAECAHQTKGADTFKPCAHAAPDWLSVNGTYSFSLPAAAAKVVDMGSIGAPRVRASGRSVDFTIAAPEGSIVVVAKRFLFARPKTDVHLRLHLDKLLIRRAMDPSCSPDQPNCPYANESTLLGQIATAPGEWQLYWSVDGTWGRWPGTLRAKDGATFRGTQSVDFWVRPHTSWTFVALARECDFGALPGWNGPGKPTAPCPATNEVGNSKGDDYPGAITVSQRGLGLGRHVVNASTQGSTCPPSNAHGCYQLTYTVTRLR